MNTSKMGEMVLALFVVYTDDTIECRTCGKQFPLPQVKDGFFHVGFEHPAVAESFLHPDKQAVN